MCGRFFIDDDTAKEIQKLLAKLDVRFQKHPTSQKWNNGAEEVGAGDIFPTDKALIIRLQQNRSVMEPSVWGFRGMGERQTVINARAESLMEKPLFQESIKERRCLIVANGFYEWDKSRNKLYFQKEDDKYLYMAGIWRMKEKESQFTIITTKANHDMEPFHDRMPLILREDLLLPWLSDKEKTKEILRLVPPKLTHSAEYEQGRLEFL